MAWRIDNNLVKAEIDNRIKGLVTGTLWFAGREKPVRLKLKGNPWRDLAGHLIRITHAKPQVGDLEMLADVQAGVVGDITASRKVKVPDVPMEEFIAGYKSGKKFSFHWANSLYLEWFSEFNGRVVIESADYTLELDGHPTWEMTEAEDETQRMANQQEITRFMDRLVTSIAPEEFAAHEESDRPTSQTEREADADNARMNRLLDRINARIEQEGTENADSFERIMEEEREKLRREMGEPDPVPLTPEQEQERAAWIEELNAGAAEALAEMEKNGTWDETPDHPLVETCRELGTRLYHDIQNHHWVLDNAPMEHPLHEIQNGVQFAGVKLAGALQKSARDEEWPPNPLFAGDTLVRLKKARNYLRDALAGMDAADEQRLADSDWRVRTRNEITILLACVNQLIDEVRATLE